jgi:hypothetical protein
MAENNRAVNKIHCVACKEDISPYASICPRCNSSQRFFRFKPLGLVLSWIGGIVTVITLIIGIFTLHQYYQQSLEKKKAITEHIDAASWLIKTKNYQQAWQMYDQASHISNSSLKISHSRLTLALLWVKNFQVDKSKLQITLNQLSVVLYRGLSTAKNDKKADILAHIGYLQVIRKINRLPIMVDVEKLFSMAFELDKNNTYASAMHARWLLLERPMTVVLIKQANEQFISALTSFKDQNKKNTAQYNFIRRIQLHSLLNYSYAFDDDIETAALKSLLNISIAMMENNESAPSTKICDEILNSYDRMGNARHLETLIKQLPTDKHLLAYQWLQQNSKEIRPVMLTQSTYIIARLNEELGNKKTALNGYQSLLSSPNSSKKLNQLINLGIKRLHN